jgi:hypothetical protein
MISGVIGFVSISLGNAGFTPLGISNFCGWIIFISGNSGVFLFSFQFLDFLSHYEKVHLTFRIEFRFFKVNLARC